MVNILQVLILVVFNFKFVRKVAKIGAKRKKRMDAIKASAQFLEPPAHKDQNEDPNAKEEHQKLLNEDGPPDVLANNESIIDI